jgi:hypothetical protein
LHIWQTTDESHVHLARGKLVERRADGKLGPESESAADVPGDERIDRQHVGRKECCQTKQFAHVVIVAEAPG